MEPMIIVLFLFSDEVTCKKRLLSFVCGISDHQMSEEEMRKEDFVASIKSLDQNPTAKIGLTVGLVVILVIGVFLYCFWSLWQYKP